MRPEPVERPSIRTYHDCMALTSEGLARPVRWSLWLGAGVLCGLSLGFVIGLAKPRMRK
jgi:hypothetical protein